MLWYSIAERNFLERGFIHEKLKNIPISISTYIPSCTFQQIQVSDTSRIARKALLAEFIQCETYDQFKAALSKFDASEFSRIPPDYSDPLRFFLDSFIFANPEKAFDIVIACIADDLCNPQAVPLAMCSIYDPQRVIDALHFDTVSKSTRYNRRNRIKEYIIDLGQHRVVFHAKNSFDPYTQFYCSELLGCYTSFPSSPVVHIYRYFDTFGVSVRYGFGFGLSYTEFEISDYCLENVSDEKITISASVKNTGKVSGKEVVQIYVSLPGVILEKEARRLCAYAKTSELKPGESEKVSLVIDMDQLTSYDEKRAAWILEGGFYGIWVGNSLASAKLCAGVKLDKEVISCQVKNLFSLKQKLEEKTQEAGITSTREKEAACISQKHDGGRIAC